MSLIVTAAYRFDGMAEMLEHRLLGKCAFRPQKSDVQSVFPGPGRPTSVPGKNGLRRVILTKGPWFSFLNTPQHQ